MDKDALVRVHCIMYEVIDFVRCFVSTIEEYLVFLVKPGISEVLNSDIGPLILYLATAAINDPGNFIGDNKLEVFRGKGVSYEEAIFDFDSTYHIVIHNGLVHRILILSLLFLLIYNSKFNLIIKYANTR